MGPPDRMDRSTLIVLGVILLFLPALLLVFTVVFLQFAGALVAAELSTLELLELYIVELVFFAAAIYVLYRTALRILTDST